ncbi:TetR/AcrR family transcriptional regulator [Actinomadura atramentaria]|uniref:TetR/AcrR family transcriptional regulator n=1 Tax=Actinomadura atramentaria TaxID=1990 RepID=UPI000363A9D1|nr:TetR/AcrR family transcriptional regulator [Actinomadura atramentaria]
MDYGTLPRGRHRLSREQVAASQRDRLFQSMTELVAERGYARCSVADVLKRARVSRETFYELFADKQSCFLGAYQRAADRILAAVAAALAGDGPPLDRFDRALRVYLEELAGDGPRARVFLLEVHAVGPDAAAHRYAVQRGFVELISDLLLADDRWRRLPDPAFACRMLVGGIAGLVSGKVATGEHAALPALRPSIVDHVGSLLRAAGPARPVRRPGRSGGSSPC